MTKKFSKKKQTAIIIGAGPAGLTAAFELLEKTKIVPIVLEKDDCIGGISKTIEYKGNFFDLGGHRFYSKYDKITDFWHGLLPLQGKPAKDYLTLGRKISVSEKKGAPDPEKIDNVMLIRNRVSRIMFLKKFFDYPVTISIDTISKLSLKKTAKIILSYSRSVIFPNKNEKSLEDFFINRFGKELYLLFFKDYTEKVWGISCNKMKPDWGAQRVKGVSIAKVIEHFFSKELGKVLKTKTKEEVSLISEFNYPKFGPGQLWQIMQKKIVAKGGKILLNQNVTKIVCKDNKIHHITAINSTTGKKTVFEADYFISTMPVNDLINSIDGTTVSQKVKAIANNLHYRNFIAVFFLLKKIKLENNTNISTINNIVPDNWIYVQEKNVKLARLQILNNWSPYLIKNNNAIGITAEYFCGDDSFWKKSEKELFNIATKELEKLGIIEKNDILDYKIAKMEKAYPVYFGGYDNFSYVQAFLDSFENLFLIGRNGRHNYSAMDDSMLTAMVAVENIATGKKSKENIWKINNAIDSSVIQRY